MALTRATPAVSNAILSGMLQATIWNENSLQYYFGNNTSLTLDTEFEAAYHAPTFYSGLPDAVFAFAAGTRIAIGAWDAVITNDFTEQTTATGVEFVIVSSGTHPGDPDMEGFFQFVGNSSAPGGGSWSIGAFSTDLPQMTASAEVGGGAYVNWTLLHEFGHALGLRHTSLVPGIGVLDNERYSVMSYNAATNANGYGHAVTPMALDIAAMQAVYGQETYAAGNNSTYSLFDPQTSALSLTEGNVGIGRAYYAIWDSGGTGDTIQYSPPSGGSTNSVLINLNAATLNSSTVSAALQPVLDALGGLSLFQALPSAVRTAITSPSHHAGGFFSQVLERSGNTFSAVDGGYAIANGAVIENAVGGANADILIGNEHANRLTGNAGDDALLGGAGTDTLEGGTVGAYSSVTASTSVPGTGQTLELTLRTPQATDDANINVTGLIRLTGGTGTNYNIAYIFDRSGSMSSSFSGNTTVADFNGNGSSNELIDGAVLAFQSLNQSIVNGGSGASDVAVIAFESGAATVYTGRADGGVNAALAALRAGGGTNFESGLQQAITFFQGAGAGTNVVFFVSDGQNNEGGSFADEVQALIAANGINAQIRAIGLGTGADLSQLNQLDNTGGAEIALSPGQLTAGLIGSTGANQIARVEILVNGVVRATIPPSELQSTSDGLRFTTNVAGLSTSASDTITARVVMNNAGATTVTTGAITVANRSDDDQLLGGADNDTYNFSAGFGSDAITEGGGALDQIVLSSGLVNYELRNSQSSSNDLEIVVEYLDVITIKNFFLGGNNVVERLTLGNGQQVNLAGGLTIQGTSSADFLRGTDNNDVLIAGAGDDQLVAGTGGGNDIYDGGTGEDTVIFTSATVAVTIDLSSSGGQASSSQTGFDNLFNIENVVAGAGADTITGNGGRNYISGMGGGDIIKGLAGDDSLYGDAGDDTIFGDDTTAGPVVVDVPMGSGQVDLTNTIVLPPAVGTSSTAVVIGNGYSLQADANIANATTSPHMSLTRTGSGVYQYYAITVVAGQTIAFDIDGAGPTFDSYLSLYSDAGVQLVTGDDSSTTDGGGGSTSGLDSFLTYTFADAGTYFLLVSEYPGTTPVRSGASYTLNISSLNPTSGGASSDGSDIIYGGDGNDTINGGGATDYIDGGVGDDSVNGDAGIDYMYGGLGRDSMNGGADIDVIYGNEDDDTIDGGAATDYVEGGGGADALSGGSGIDYLYGGDGNDTIRGGTGVDVIYGNDGNDTLFGFSDTGSDDNITDYMDGGAGNDTLSGGGGIDYLYGGSGTDTLDGGNDIDVLYGEADGDTLNGGAATDYLDGGAGDDTLNGGDGFDFLYGGDGVDTLRGGADGDTLQGNAGNDILTGGTGIDYFQMTSGMGTDTITDFEDNVDRIDLTLLGIGFSGVTISQSGANALVASGANQILVQNIAASSLTASDFYFL